jgi:glycine/D-amino acid oxidase-like deaminating enzyme
MVKNGVYWWGDAPLAETAHRPVQPVSDVVIVGAGYTGLSAAITLARAGRSVQVFDRQRPGEGASTRNGGITSGNLRLSHGQLVNRFGPERGDAIVAEAKAAREDLYRFIAEDRVECDFAPTGRFSGASNPGDYEGLAREAELLRSRFGIEAHEVPRAGQRAYLGTDFYHGGAVRMDVGGLHPAKLHAEMLRLALAAGVTVHGETGVTGVRAEGTGFEVETARGRVKAGHVVMGVNGYTDKADSWLRQRFVPVRSRMIATERLSPELMDELMPRRMMCSETRRLYYYYRPSPDGTRILFGGRDGTIAGDPSWPVAHLTQALIDIFPQVKDVGVSQSWFGHVAMNRDSIPRIFGRQGVRYAGGYCGSGVVWARWAGQKVARQILNEQDGRSALDFRPPGFVPIIAGKAWFMPVVFGWLSSMDALAKRRRAKG